MTGQSGAERPLVVGVDPSDSARDAALWAVDLAAARGCGVELVHVVPGRARAVPDWLTELADTADRAGAVPCQVHVVTGAVFDVLLTRSQTASMIIVGSFGPDAPAGMLVGSTALTLLARAGCSVAVIRGHRRGLGPPRSGPILAGADGTPASDHALDVAADLAASLGTELVIVRAWSALRSDPAGGVHRTPTDKQAPADEAGRDLDEQLGRLRARRPGLTVQQRLVAATPLQALLEQAHMARAIVVGQRTRRGPPGRAHLGSTSRGLVTSAACPVVVARMAATRGSRDSAGAAPAGGDERQVGR
jgi:nucleotide-binding universal stress UspA family protein